MTKCAGGGQQPVHKLEGRAAIQWVPDRLDEQEPPEVQQGQMQSCTWEEESPCNDTGWELNGQGVLS